MTDLLLLFPGRRFKKQRIQMIDDTMFNVAIWSGFWTPPGLHALAPALPFLILWEGFWKGLGLWHSGRRGQPVWFVILIVVNSIGILPIIYLFAVAHLKASELFSKKT